MAKKYYKYKNRRKWPKTCYYTDMRWRWGDYKVKFYILVKEEEDRLKYKESIRRQKKVFGVAYHVLTFAEISIEYLLRYKIVKKFNNFNGCFYLDIHLRDPLTYAWLHVFTAILIDSDATMGERLKNNAIKFWIAELNYYMAEYKDYKNRPYQYVEKCEPNLINKELTVWVKKEKPKNHEALKKIIYTYLTALSLAKNTRVCHSSNFEWTSEEIGEILYHKLRIWDWDDYRLWSFEKKMEEDENIIKQKEFQKKKWVKFINELFRKNEKNK